MNSAIISTTSNYIQKKGLWLILGLLGVVSLSIAIAYAKWIYLGALLIPLFVYISIAKPFIFPFGLYVFLLPFESLLDSYLTKLLGALIILVLSLKSAYESRLQKPNTAAIWWVLFVSYCCLSSVWAIELKVGNLVTAISLLLFYLITVSYKINKREYETLKWFIFSGGLVTALILIHNYLIGDFANVYHQKTSLTFGDKETGSDLQAFLLLLPITVGISLMLEQKKKISQILMLISSFIIIIGVITTGTRGALLSICIILIVYLYSIDKRGIGVMVLVAVAITIALTPEHVIDQFGNSSRDGGAGRLDIWMVGMKSLEKYWLFGAGFNNFPLAYNNYVDYVAPWSYFRGLGRGSHNIYLGIFVELGIVGLVLLIIVFTRHFKAISTGFTQNSNDQIMLKATFWGMLTQSFFIDTTWLKPFWLLWMMILMYRNCVVDDYRKNINAINNERVFWK